MAHRTVKNSYSMLADRINKFPQGAPASPLLFSILKMLYSEKEAKLVSQLPIKPFKPGKAAKVWKMKESEATKILNTLATRALLVDIERNGEMIYSMPPPMAGFFEFSMMRVRGDIDQKALAELFYQYLNVEEDFIKSLFTEGETQLGRTYVNEAALSEENALHVLDYERATEVIHTASHRGVGICYCRHKMAHMGKSCEAPQDICMTFNSSAQSLVRHGNARSVSKEECLDLLDEAYENKLVQFGENVQTNVNFICNCCGCCCEAMIAARRFAILDPIHTTNFLPLVLEEECNGCGKCLNVCPVEAMSLVSSNNPARPNEKLARLDMDICLGCGVCVRSCSQNAILLKSREQRVITPVDGTNRIVMMAIERGKLQNLIFDNQVLWSHRALAGVLGTILKLPPVKQAMASRQMKSRYLESIIKRYMKNKN